MKKITVETVVAADVADVWEHWTNPKSITGWAFASDTWECPYAENDVRVGGRFLTRMAAKDGSEGFDFTGTYREVEAHMRITYRMDAAEGEEKQRECEVRFTNLGNHTTRVEEVFDPEAVNSEDVQRAGWSAILENFKNFVERKQCDA